MTGREQDIASLLQHLLGMRNLCEEVRVLCLAESVDNGWEKKREETAAAKAMARHCIAMSHQLFPEQSALLNPFMISAVHALDAASIMFDRQAELSFSKMEDMKDPGHFNCIQKHMNSSRRTIGVLAREAREAAHIAQFLINRIDGVRDAKSA